MNAGGRGNSAFFGDFKRGFAESERKHKMNYVRALDGGAHYGFVRSGKRDPVAFDVIVERSERTGRYDVKPVDAGFGFVRTKHPDVVPDGFKIPYKIHLGDDDAVVFFP